MSQPTTRGPLLWFNLVVVYIVWGSTYAGIAVADQSIPPLIGISVRFLFGAALLGAWMGLTRRSLRVTRIELKNVTFVAIALLVAGTGGVFISEEHLPSSYVSLLICGTPIWLAFFRKLAGDHPSRKSLTGVGIGLVGMVVLLFPALQSARTEASDLWWSLFMLAGSLSWSYGSFRAKKLEMPRDPLVMTFWEMAIGGAVLSLIAAASRQSVVIADITPASLWALLYLVLFGSLLAYTSYVWLLANAPISLVGTYAYVNPVIAVLLGRVLLQEPLGWNIWVGGLIILSGVGLTVSAER